MDRSWRFPEPDEHGAIAIEHVTPFPPMTPDDKGRTDATVPIENGRIEAIGHARHQALQTIFKDHRLSWISS